METKTLPESASSPSVNVGKEKEETQPEQIPTKKRKLETLCSICGVSYNTPSQGQSDEGPFICNSCKKRNTNSDHVKPHLKIQSPHRQNICRICGSHFSTSPILGNHLRHHNINHIHLCEQCGEGFQESEKLEKHEQLHKLKADVQQGSESTDGVPGTSAKTLDSEGLWMGCARFCLTEIPSISNHILQTSDEENENNSEENANVTESTTPDLNNTDSNPSSEEDSDFPQFSVSAGYSLVGTTSDSQEESEAVEAVTSSSNPSVFMVDAPQENETAVKTMSTTSLLTTTSPNAVVRREPVVTNVATSTPARCAISLLAVNRTNMMPTGRVVSSTTPTTLAPKAVVLTVPKEVTTTTNTTPLSLGSTSTLARKTFFLAMPNGMAITSAAGPPSFGHPPLAPKAVFVTVPQDVAITSTPSSLGTTPTQASKPVFLSVPKEVTKTTTTGPSSTGTAPFMMNGKRVGQCEHCGMWFEDYAMCLLHKSLHSADDANPFTCQKCMKKLGNRLEFMAHLVWHLDPDVP